MDFVQYKKRFCFPVDKFYAQVGLDKDKYVLLADRFAVVYRENWHKIKIHNGIEDYLKRNLSQDIQQFILSAYNQKELLDMVEFFNLQNYFTQIAGIFDNLAKSKTQRGKELIANNKIDIDRTLLIGDTPHDFEVASELGTDVVLVSWGTVSYEKLVEKCGQEFVVKDLKEVFVK
jgi:phosphoglycolate phosphatase